LNCPWHPNKRVVSACKDCGADFCIECVRETDQTTFCPDCYRRKLSEITREFTEPEESKEELKTAVVTALPRDKRRPPAEKTVVPPEEEAEEEREIPAARKREHEKPERAMPGRGIIGRMKERKKRERVVSAPPPPPTGDFLSQGPDEDFGKLTEERRKRERKTQRVAAATAMGTETVEAPRVEEKAPAPESKAQPEENLLQDVVSTLLAPEERAGARPDIAPPDVAAPEVASIDAVAVEASSLEVVEPRIEPEKARKRAPAKVKVKASKEERAERWSFLSQPRTTEYTVLSASWWRSAIFVALMILLGAVMWSVVNAYIRPTDKEYGILAIVIGVIIGLAFWWKAGKKHSTKLAVQSALVTFFALFFGEFLHWFLIIMKHSAFRTIFFDLVSFKFLWENGAEIMKNVIDAMFPTGFILLLVLPMAIAFVIGFGMPPIPEIFFQIWRALKGGTVEDKEARHGVEG
jgi:hypothetical protein